MQYDEIFRQNDENAILGLTVKSLYYIILIEKMLPGGHDLAVELVETVIVAIIDTDGNVTEPRYEIPVEVLNKYRIN